LTIRSDKDVSEWLEHQSKRTGQSRGKTVRDQLARAKSDTAQSFMGLAGKARGPRTLSTRRAFSLD